MPFYFYIISALYKLRKRQLLCLCFFHKHKTANRIGKIRNSKRNYQFFTITEFSFFHTSNHTGDNDFSNFVHNIADWHNCPFHIGAKKHTGVSCLFFLCHIRFLFLYLACLFHRFFIFFLFFFSYYCINFRLLVNLSLLLLIAKRNVHFLTETAF